MLRDLFQIDGGVSHINQRSQAGRAGSDIRIVKLLAKGYSPVLGARQIPGYRFSEWSLATRQGELRFRWPVRLLRICPANVPDSSFPVRRVLIQNRVSP